MITKIEIENAASYKNKVEIRPKKINFIYGSNGSGKTTISRLLNAPNQYIHSSVIQGEEHSILVYNNDFVDLHFNNNSLIQGIFTLGKDSNDILEKIKALEEERNELIKKINDKKNTLNKQEGALNEKKTNFNERCWSFKNEYNTAFKDLFIGKVGNKELFAKYCLSINPTESERKSIEELKKLYDSLYIKKLSILEKIEYPISINISDLPGIISLNESITSNKTLQISILIDK